MADLTEAREKLIGAVLRRVSSERGREDDAHYADELDYCDDMILEAAKGLVEADEESKRRFQQYG